MIFLASILASFAGAFVLSSALNWLALIPWRRSGGAHWTERARRLYPTRIPIAQAFALLPMKDMLFSEPLLQVLTDEELESVCAHEAGHLTESKWVLNVES
jgi:Zn-dependent protease with chaperone function